MKRLRITVDGTVYDVTVEDVASDAPAQIPAPHAAPAAAAAAAPAPAVAAPAPKEPAPQPGSAGAGDVVSPLAGTVLKIDVSVGQSVNAGDPVLLLEAMKMESVMVAPTSGTVKSINIASGASVQEGEVLLTIG